MSANRLPVWFIPHGGGPCFFMDPPPKAPDAWKKMEGYLRGIAAEVGERPRAILIISGHWLEKRPTVTASANPPLIYDYFGFPKHTYELRYPAPGDPRLAAEIVARLKQAGIDAGEDKERCFDHSVFIPLLLL